MCFLFELCNDNKESVLLSSADFCFCFTQTFSLTVRRFQTHTQTLFSAFIFIMTSKYPSTYIEKYPRKLAFLIDCVNGINSFALSSQIIDNFPTNSDIFLFYPNNEPGMNRRFKRIESHNRGVFFYPTSEFGIGFHLSFILGQINDKYDDFIFLVEHHPAYEDLCHELINNNSKLKNHIQVRSFERFNEFEQFIKEMTRLQNENETKKLKDNQKVSLNYSRKHLFHACPYESRQESSNLYRFGEFLHHLDSEHTNVQYDYCTECQQILEKHNYEEQETFEEHLKDKHWQSNGFHLNIRPL